MIEKQRKMNISFVFAVINIIYLNGCMFTFLQKSSLATYIGFASFFIWLILTVLIDHRILINDLLTEVPLFFCFCFLLFLHYIVNVNDISSLNIDFLRILYIIMITSISLYYIRDGFSRQRRVLISIWLVDTLVSCVYTCYKLTETPLLSRYLSTGNVSNYIDSDVSTYGVMTFSNAYGMLFLIMMFMFLLLDRNKITSVKKTSIIILVFIMLITVVYMSFTISIILTILGMTIAIFYTFYKGKNGFLWIIFFAFLALLLILNVETIINFFINQSFMPYAVKERLQELLRLISFGRGNMQGTDLAIRGQLYGSSFKAMVENAFLGKALFGNGTIGGHSEILDMLASYGVIYFGMIMVSFLQFTKSVKKVINTKSFEWYRLILLLFVLLSFINTSFWAPTIENLFLIIPFLLVDYSRLSKKTGTT